jgi:hypothetical protein
MAGTHSNEHFYTSFPFIFFGLLLLAGIFGFVLHKRWKGLPKIGENFYDPIVLSLGLWCLAGLLIDAFAHIAGNVDDTFFTPWHAVWYSGAVAYGAYIFYAILPDGGIQQLIREPFATLKGVESQHRAGVYGIIIFAVSGFGDLIWHETLGVEENTDILLSPTHIGLFIGLIMSVTAPLWSAWADATSGKNGLSSQLLIVFGAGAAWCVALLMVRYANLWFAPLQSYCYSGSLDFCDNQDYNFALEQGLKSLFIQAALTSAVLAIFLQRWKPARGAMFTLFMFHAVGVWVYSEFDSNNLTMGLTLAIAAEIVAFGYERIGPKVYIPLMAASQVIVFMIYGLIGVGDIADTSYWIEGVNIHVIPFGWSIHSTIGSIVVCASIGWFASLIAFPPQHPDAIGNE